MNQIICMIVYQVVTLAMKPWPNLTLALFVGQQRSEKTTNLDEQNAISSHLIHVFGKQS